MKKLLAMVLALVMTLSLAVSANAFKDDKSISDDYAEAVAVLNGMGVFKGYEDGSFQPKGDITRAEVSAIVYRVYTQDVKDAKASMYATYNKFSDMAGAGWAQGYIGYCANAELVKGYPDGTFKPSGKVTGYEVLAMILRAVGYDKNGEFSGADWALHVAQTAQQAGVLKNVKGIDLNAPATRELVAELLFRAVAESSMVTYTPAFGYVTDKVLGNTVSTLGYKNFKLVGKASSDDWGRPGTNWTYNVGDKSTFAGDKADATYATKVAECDIAKDLGLTKETKIEAAYIDGAPQTLTSPAVTTNRYATIKPLATSSEVGEQGRITEVYNMGADGVRIVEINTYLAHVDSVVAAKTDKNGHVDDAYSKLTIYADAKSAGVLQANDSTLKAKTADYAKDSYVLVTVNAADKALGYVSSVEEAKVAASGTLTKYSTTTTTVGGVEYKNADKYVLGAPGAFGSAYDVYVDANGNIIGLVPTAKNYLVVEAIAWQYDGIYNGYAEANVVLADGTRAERVKVATVNGFTASATGTENANNYAYTAGVVSAAKVSAFYTNNKDYYNHIFTYSIDADGNYNISKHVANANMDLTSANYDIAITTGMTTIKSKTNTVVANDNTVFLVKDQKTGIYTSYVGKNNVPTMNAKELCVLTSGGYASLVLVTDYESANDRFVAYIPSLTTNGSVTTEQVNGNVVTVYSFDAYKLGTTENTGITYTADRLDNTISEQYARTSGLFVVTQKDGIVTNMKRLVNDANDATSASLLTETESPYKYGRVFANDSAKGMVLQTVSTNASGAVAVADLYLDNVKAYIAIDQATKTLTETTADTIVAGEKLMIAYTEDNGVVRPVYVYIIRNSNDPVNNPTTTGSINYYVTFKNANGTVINETPVLVATQSGLADAKVYNNVNWAFLSGAMGGAATDGTFTVKNATQNFSNYTSTDNYNNVTIVAGQSIDLYFVATAK